MYDKIRFGIPMAEFRTKYGTLRTRELERIISFLNKKGILIANCFDRKIIIVHPHLVRSIQEKMINAGFKSLLISATVSNLRKNEALNLAQNRVLEALTPGAIIIERTNEENSKLIAVAVPDNSDLRDICSSYEGTIHGFITDKEIDENELIESISKIKLDEFDMNKIGILEFPYFDENSSDMIATVVHIYGSDNIKLTKEGAYDYYSVKQATNQVSQYEIGEWT